MARFSRRGLLLVVVAITLAGALFGLTRVIQDTRALIADLRHQMDDRADGISRALINVRAVGDVVAQDLATAGGGSHGTRCPPSARTRADGEPPDCLWATLAASFPVSSLMNISRLAVLGEEGVVVAYPALPPPAPASMPPPPVLSRGAALPPCADEACRLWRRRRNAGGDSLYGPFRGSLSSGQRALAYVIPVRIGGRPPLLLATLFNVSALWWLTLPVSGPANHLMLGEPRGGVVVDSRVLPEQTPTTMLPALPEEAPPIEGDSHWGDWWGGDLVLRHPVADSDWTLYCVMPVSAVWRWILREELPLLGALTALLIALWAGTLFTYRRVLRPAIRLESLLLQTLADIRLTFDSLSEGLCLLDCDGRVRGCNGALTPVLGLPATIDPRGMTLAQLRDRLDRPSGDGIRSDGTLGDEGYRALDIMGIRSDLSHGEATARYVFALPPDRWVEARYGRAVRQGRRQGGREVFIAVFTDITERRRAEMGLVQARDRAQAALAELEATRDQLIETEKMAALGGLVAGVAHEVNTPIGVCVTAASTLEMRLDALARALAGGTLQGSQVQSFIEMGKRLCQLLGDNLERATRLITSFKQVAVDQHVDETHLVNVKAYIDEAVLSLRHELRRGQHQLSVEGVEDLVVRLVPAQLWQIVSNLVLNAARHAFPGRIGGHITVRVERRGAVPVLQVADDGIGMDETVRKRCFEPFFTTKRGEGGSGLGLAVVHSIVTGGLGGRISVDSAPGHGTRFTITLPPQGDGAIPAPVPAGEAPPD